MEESLEDLEARLYAQVFHDANIEAIPESDVFLPPNLNKQSTKRYWMQQSKNLALVNVNNQSYINNSLEPIKNNNRVFSPKPRTPIRSVSADNLPEIETSAKKIPTKFVPYSSVLPFMSPPAAAPMPKNAISMSPNYEKKKNKPNKFPNQKSKLLNPFCQQGITKSKSAMKAEIQAKKEKATNARKKAQQKIITIDLETDSDGDESDDVIPIELPPPPLITLDSSDEETIRKNKRCLSPSSSSIISDDFIVAGDKRRLMDQQKTLPVVTKIQQRKETMEKVKALTKPSSTESSSSARSSCERNTGAKTPADSKKSSPPKKRKSINHDRNSIDKSNEDSIYKAKARTKQVKAPSSESSNDDTTSCVISSKKQKIRRRKSTASSKKSTDGDDANSEIVEDPKLKLIAALAPKTKKKRSRFITPSYNDDEFASMITKILRTGDVPDSGKSDTDSRETAVNKSIEDSPSTNCAQDTETMKKSQSLVIPSPNDDDCEIIESPALPVFEVPDEDEKESDSDSDDSMKDNSGPVECDISLNVTQVAFEPHESIRDQPQTHEGLSSNRRSAIDDVLDPEVGWNDEMKFFYNQRWGEENFYVSSIMNKMSADQRNWKIINADRVRMQTDSKYRNTRCRNCNEFGHLAAKCKRPKKQLICFMCGAEGHRETRCPNALCLKCGKPNKIFSTVCMGCARISKSKNCPLCRFIGHDIEQCPDKWRRYHSTTTDTTELNSEYVLNKRVYCSICARRGHHAENCSQFMKTLNGCLTSSCVNIVSHKPSYPRIFLDSFDIVPEENQQLFALFTYLDDYRFNYKFPSKCQLYRKFKEYFEAYQQRQTLPAITNDQRPKKKCKKNKNKQIAESTNKEPPMELSFGEKIKLIENQQNKQREDVFAVDFISLNATENYNPSQSSNLQITVSSKNENQRLVTIQSQTNIFHEDSNSNYSFSEFYIEQNSSAHGHFKSPAGTIKEAELNSLIKAVPPPSKTTPTIENPKMTENPLASSIQPLPDFISINDNNQNIVKPIAVEKIPEVRSNARVLLTKEHCSILIAERGRLFLQDLKSRLNIDVEFAWDNTGNSMMIEGLPNDQSLFHVEVREFLYRIELDKYEKAMAATTQVPKQKPRIINFIKENLKSITKLKIPGVRRMLEAMLDAEKSLNYKKAVKCRKMLNIAFIGDGELLDGATHLSALRRILFNLEKDEETIQVPITLRSEIYEHMKYIFSSMNHGDYKKLFDQYIMTLQQRSRQRLMQNPICL